MNPDTDPNNTPPADGTTPTPTPDTQAEPVLEATPSPVPAADDAPVTPVESPAAIPTPETTTSNSFASANATTPADSATPAAPVATPFVASSGAPAPKKTNTNKIILIASIVGGVVILGIIAVVLFLMFTTVSKQDYRDAAVQFNSVSRSSSALTSSASTLGRSASGSTSDATFQESLKASQDAIAKIETENDELSKLKAVRVGEGAELYKTFNDKVDAYVGYAKGLVTSVENIRPAMVVCDKVSDANDPAARVTALKACSTALGDVKDLPNSSFKKFVEEIKKAYASYATTYEGIAALTSPYGAQAAQYRTLRDEMSETQKNISAASKEFTTSLTESDKQFSVKESADKLGDYLTEQQR